MNCCVTIDQLRHHTTSGLQLHEQRSDVQQQKSERFVWIDGAVPIAKKNSWITFCATGLRVKPRTWTTSCALRLSMPPSPLRLSTGHLELRRQSTFSFLNQAFENARGKAVPSSRASISIVACVEEDKGALGSFTLCSIMANGRMIPSQILTSGILHADIHDLVVEILGVPR